MRTIAILGLCRSNWIAGLHLNTTAQSPGSKHRGMRRRFHCDKHLQSTTTTDQCVGSDIAPVDRNCLCRLWLHADRANDFAL